MNAVPMTLQCCLQNVRVFHGSSDFEDAELHHRRLRGGFHGAKLMRTGRRVRQDQDAPGRGRDLADQLQPFSGQVGQIEKQAGDVPARPSDARREAALDRIVFETAASL